MENKLGLLLPGEFYYVIDEIDMCDQHPPTAIPIQVQLLEYLFRWNFLLLQLAILLPFISDEVAASEAANWDYHL